MTKQERAEMYRSYLVDEGYAPKIDDDGDVAFKFEGRSYYIAVSADDEHYFRLVFPAFWQVESEEERERMKTAALHATAETKVAKVFLVRDNTWASVEMFCAPPEVFKPVFQRSLRALSAAAETFRTKMNE